MGGSNSDLPTTTNMVRELNILVSAWRYFMGSKKIPGCGLVEPEVDC